VKYVVGCVVSAVLGCVLTFWMLDSSHYEEAIAQDRTGPRGPLFPITPTQPKRSPDQIPTQELPQYSSEESIGIAVYENVNKSVVNIMTRTIRPEGMFFFDLPTQAEDTGSGCVIDRAGHVLTNFHVIENARAIGVTLYDGETYGAKLIGADPINDLAVLKIDAPKQVLHPLNFGDSARLKVGMRVFAIGNPFGLERTMTTGIISSLNRSLQVMENRTIKSIIQIDAAVNPGNSGGPLLDSRGRMIGINTAIASKTGQNSGIGFAIPVNLITRVVPQLIRHGRVIRAEIGIQRVYETEQGLLIARMTQGGPAEQAGLRGPQIVRTRRGPFMIERLDRTAADLIIAIDGQTAKTAEAFLSYIESKKPGERVTLTVLRQGKEVHVTVTLGGGKQVQNELQKAKEKSSIPETRI